MGKWGNNPWENDTAADWFGTFMAKTRMRSVVLHTIRKELIDDGTYGVYDEARAAITMFLMLGRHFVWPTNDYESDLVEVLDKAKQIRAILLNNPDRPIPHLDEEIAILQNRLDWLQRRIPRPTEAAWPWNMD